MTEALTREQFFNMAGLSANAAEGAYTPVSLGKGNKIRDSNRSWIRELRRVDFTDSNQLRALTPENVSASSVFVNDEMQSKFKAIVGDNTHKVYSIQSNRYQIVQNKILIDALAVVSENTGIQIFGKMNDHDGKMSINAFFADPDCNVDFGSYHGGKGSDPYMLGVRMYNSHTGDSGFGAEITGVRWLCSNMVAFGDVLGKVHWKHLVQQEEVIGLVESMIRTYMSKVPVLKDRIEEMSNEVLTLDEAECALWGIKVSPFMAEGITENMFELNPEIRHRNGKVSVYDVFNATTAYNTYSNTGSSEFGRTEISHKAQKLITQDIQDLIDVGTKARENYNLAQMKMTAQNTVLVG